MEIGLLSVAASVACDRKYHTDLCMYEAVSLVVSYTCFKSISHQRLATSILGEMVKNHDVLPYLEHEGVMSRLIELRESQDTRIRRNADKILNQIPMDQ